MKRFLAILLVLFIISLTFASCVKSAPNNNADDTDDGENLLETENSEIDEDASEKEEALPEPEP